MKKVLLLTLLAILALSLTACGAPAEEAPAEQGTTFVSDGLVDLSYSVPEGWERKEDNSTTLMYYPNYEGAAAVLSLWMEDVKDDAAFDVEANKTVYILVYTSGCKDYSPELTEDVTIAGGPGLHHIFNYTSQNFPARCELYAFTVNNQLYAFSSIMNSEADESIIEDMSAKMQQVVESMTVN